MSDSVRVLGRACGVLALVIVSGCAVPRMLWPQRDIAAVAAAGPARVLVASRSSEFKDALVGRLREALGGRGVAVAVTGVDELKDVDASRYAVVVVINTCIAWGFDSDVQAFLDRQPQHRNIIVVTTAGDPEWRADLRGREFDAITSASEPAGLNDLAADVLSRIDSRLAAPAAP